MEHSNHPFRKENDLPNLYDYVPCQSSRAYPLFLDKEATKLLSFLGAYWTHNYIP